jgi:putative Holliday junction resolvase
VVYWDERFTSVTAERSLVDAGVRRAERREVRDKVAAAVMLQAYLDHTGNNDRSRTPDA